MSKLKDKLTANMRTVKHIERTDVGEPAAHAGSASDRPAVAPRDAPGKAARLPVGSGTQANFDTPVASTALFPSRVWPD